MRRLSSAVPVVLAKVVLLVLCTLSLVTLSHAQYRASIQGVVTDSTGAVVPGATVTITDKETSRTQTATSDANGIYNLTALPPSTYIVRAEKTGFKKKEILDYKVIAEQANSLDLQLEVGQSSETVNVSADSIPAIDTETAQISGTVDSKHIQSMPSFGRDIFQLAQLAPGVFGDGSQQSGGGAYGLPSTTGGGTVGNSTGPFITENKPQVFVNGQRNDQNNITIDGIGVTSVSWGGASVVTPNEDSVKELKVVSNSYDAENGRFGAGQIQIISQNGTNQYHGSLFFKRDTPGLNAYQHWNGPVNNPQLPVRNNAQFNDWGGSAGGPIIKNKLFAFFSYERIANSGTTQEQGWFETPQLLALAPGGSIASAYAAYPGMSVHYSTQVDQTCASVNLVQGVNCLEIPGSGLNIGRPLNPSAFPLGTQDPSFASVANCGLPPNALPCQIGLGGDGTGSAANLDPTTADIFNVQSTGPSINTNQQYNGRLDFNATSKDLVAFNIYYVPVSSLSYNGWRSADLFNHSAVNEALTALWDHTFSPSLINEVRVNGAGWRWNELAENPQIPLGLPQPAFIGNQAAGNTTGSLVIDANGALGGVAGSIFDQWTINFKDVATKVYHAHSIKFGGEITRLKFVQDAPWSARPNWGFSNLWDFLNDAPGYETGTYNPQNGVPTDVRKDVRANIWGFFVQDDWKLRPNLTVNLGMRWEYFGPISDLHGLLSTVVLGPGTGALTNMSMRLGGNLYNADHGDFGPRIGFAWSPSQFNSKLVLRGGFGISYTGEEEAITLNGWPNIPFDDGGATFTGSNVVYAIPSNPHQFEPYPANPNAILTFGSNNIPTEGAPASVTAFPANFHTTYIYSYSFDAQYDLGRAWVASLGYQGSAGHHLTLQNNLNLIYGNAGLALNPFINNVDNYAQIGNSNSNAMLAQLKHSFSRSFDLDASYRWAHSMDNGSQPYSIPNFQWNPATAYGASDFNVTNAFKLWGLYAPTFFHGGNAWMEKLAGGWSFSGIMNWHDGFPWTPYYYASTCNLIYENGGCQNGSTTQLLPAQYLGGAGSDYSNSKFLSAGGNFPNGGPAYFVGPTVTPCTATFPATCPGTAPQAPGFGRNSLKGPGYFDLDATIVKGFGLPKAPIIGEGARLEFRANFYNLTNKLNLNNLDTTVTDSHFGEAQGALGSRTIELQARFSF